MPRVRRYKYVKGLHKVRRVSPRFSVLCAFLKRTVKTEWGKRGGGLGFVARGRGGVKFYRICIRSGYNLLLLMLL